ncbi:MAG TPA: methyltransferase domain-containing protein [Flavisolibacter sp.]|nr:methyltransferase domain-containing protein [Flavisolibacter sp.]
MKNSVARYRKSIKIAKEAEPQMSLSSIFFKKCLKKIRQKYHAIRIIVSKDSTFLDPDKMYMCSLFPVHIIDRVIQEFDPQSVLDVGCGTGISLEYFLQKNIDGVGIENSKLAISRSSVKDKIIRHNLNKPLNLKRKFDLVWSFEVIEHIHPHFESIFLNTLVLHSDRIIISAAMPNQGGHGHFNEQLPEYWIQKFSNLGYGLNNVVTEHLRSINEMHAKNMLVFERK